MRSRSWARPGAEDVGLGRPVRRLGRPADQLRSPDGLLRRPQALDDDLDLRSGWDGRCADPCSRRSEREDPGPQQLDRGRDSHSARGPLCGQGIGRPAWCTGHRRAGGAAYRHGQAGTHVSFAATNNAQVPRGATAVLVNVSAVRASWPCTPTPRSGERIESSRSRKRARTSFSSCHSARTVGPASRTGQRGRASHAPCSARSGNGKCAQAPHPAGTGGPSAHWFRVPCSATSSKRRIPPRSTSRWPRAPGALTRHRSAQSANES